METNANQKVSCMVNFAYDASEPDELTIRQGDVIRDVERLPGGWWRGELRGRRGMFPDNFVSVLEHANSRSSGVQGRCRAVFSYQPANPDELPLCVGDVLEVLGEVEEGWWQGRRQGRVGVFPSNFVVMLEPPQAAPPYEPAPALPPKPVKEYCRVLFPYAAVNEDELTLAEGDIVTIVSKDAPDRGWWRGELHGKVGLFPDNFVHLLPPVVPDVEEKKPDRPPSKTTNAIYPVLNKYSEKTAPVKELTTSKISVHKENVTNKEPSTQSIITHTNKSESEKLTHNEAVNDGTLDQIKKPPVPLKKSPTPNAGVGSIFSGLKNKMLPSNEKEKSSSNTVSSSGSSSGGEWDRPDGGAPSKPAPAPAPTTNTNTFDHIERNSILNDPRAGRVKAPRRRPPSQVFREDVPLQVGLSNGHDGEKPPEKAERTERPPERAERALERTPERTERAEEIKPRTREWEKHKAPWMEELKLNQAKKTSFIADGKSRSSSVNSEAGVASKAGSGSTDRILDCGLEDKRSSHSMEMSKSTSSISNRMSILDSFEESVARHSLDARRDATAAPRDPELVRPAQSPTAAGRTIMSTLEEVKKPQAPPPPVSSPPPMAPAAFSAAVPATLSATVPATFSATVPTAFSATVPATFSSTIEKSPNAKVEKPITTPDKPLEINSVKLSSSMFEKTSTIERIEKSFEKHSSSNSIEKPSSGTLERRLHALKTEKTDNNDALIAQLNSRISNLEKLIEVQNSVFNATIEDLTAKLKQEADKRQALQAEVERLAQCVAHV
ncbi:unnamed protein product [Arctia plantaginis]|uniref:SH3 domain-containing protein n=1 Tax=Arctia plantaginis TaxID=874455 RepID=A0A8S0ZXQ3_ARCPL|nr:unnamed protein product [Arctia plantaginis]